MRYAKQTTTSTQLFVYIQTALAALRTKDLLANSIPPKYVPELYKYERELLSNSQITKDLHKILCDEENFSFVNNTSILITPNGLPYLLGYKHGDWELPVYFIVYLDHKLKLRAYIPMKGNTFNPYTKAAFGNEDIDEDIELQQWIKLGFAPDDYDAEALQAALNIGTDINLPLFEQDIDNRIKLI